MKTIETKPLSYFSISILTLVLFFTIFSLIQNQIFYEYTVGLIELCTPGDDYVRNYLAEFNHENLKTWDSAHYFKIGTKGYDDLFEYAFFPLYPLLVKIVPDLVAQVFINYFLYVVGSYFILKSKDDFVWSYFNIIVVFTAPFLFVILIPYSEALMVFCFGVGWFLKKKGNKWIYPLMFVLAGMIRASNVFMVACIGFAALFVLIIHKKSYKEVIKQFDWVIYIGLGVLAASIVQMIQGAPHLLSFVEAQKYWGKKFSLPTRITCWSTESFSLNSFVLFVLFPLFISKISEWYKDMKTNFSLDNSFKWSILIYFIGLVILVYTTQSGILFGLYRFICCTPFFLLIIHKKNNQIGTYLLFCLTAFFFYNSHINVQGHIGISQLGFFIFIFYILFMFFEWEVKNKYMLITKWTLLIIVFIVNLFFTSICLYKFLSDSYIIT